MKGGVYTIVQAALIVLKLAGGSRVDDWSWWKVLVPTWLFLLVVALMLFAAAADQRPRK